MKRVLALTREGQMTYCSAPEDKRGIGRCNHVEHQRSDESVEDFICRVSSKVITDDFELPDQKEYIETIVDKYAYHPDPNWQEKIEEIPNPFTIGTPGTPEYKEAVMTDFVQERIQRPDGDVMHLTATYEFEGKQYVCDFGEVPALNDDGTITMDGANWRVLPVVEQHKAGVVSYYENAVFKQEDGNVAFSISKINDDMVVKIRGEEVPMEYIQNYLQNGDKTGLNAGQIYALDHLDPIIEERFPDFKENLAQFKELPPDEVGDLTYRRCLRYEDIVQNQMKLQMRRMGVTFRTNYAKRRKDCGDDPEAALDEKYDRNLPLFYQVNLTSNIKQDLVSRSNVQNADNLNPIAALSQAQKISFTGPGGFNKDSAPYDLRMPHRSHEGLIDPMDISSGKNVGLTGTLSMGEIGPDRLIRPKQGPTLSPSDFIPYKHYNDPTRGIMAVAHMKQACPIVGGEDPVVSTPAWDQISGAKLGTNLNIAYVPMDGVYEDAVVISQSAANKMATVQRQTYSCKDTSGLQVGQKVTRKQVIGNSVVKVGGTITAINPDNSYEVETTYKMTPGDKLAGRYGNKSVVSRVVPDDEMPKIVRPDGKVVHAEVIMSPLSVIGRKNLGQVMEANEGFGQSPDIDHKNTVVLNNGTRIQATSGKAYCLRLNHIAEKKLSSFADETDVKRESEGARLGEMESILLSQSSDRLKVLNYLRHQEAQDSHRKLHSLLKAVGVDLQGVNWND